MTKPLADGNVAERTYGDLEAASEQNMDRLLVALLDLKDGDGKTETAFNILLEMYKDEAQRLRIMTYLRLKFLNDAEALAQRLVARDKAIYQLKR